MGLILEAPATLKRHFAICVAKKFSAEEGSWNHLFWNICKRKNIFDDEYQWTCASVKSLSRITHLPLTSLLPQPKGDEVGHVTKMLRTISFRHSLFKSSNYAINISPSLSPFVASFSHFHMLIPNSDSFLKVAWWLQHPLLVSSRGKECHFLLESSAISHDISMALTGLMLISKSICVAGEINLRLAKTE